MDNIKDLKKVSIITETEKDNDILNVLTFEIEKIKEKGNELFIKVVGDSKIKNVRRHISKLKIDKML